MRLLALALLPMLALAGCTSNEPEALDADAYEMELSGMPSGPMAPGSKFNVTVQAHEAHAGHGMHMSDHIGAHFWNATQADPTGALASSTACAHTGGNLPGTHRAQCTAPLQPGTYHIRAHARMAGDDGMMLHWWGDEHTFTVA